jgi:hypothetical protein
MAGSLTTSAPSPQEISVVGGNCGDRGVLEHRPGAAKHEQVGRDEGLTRDDHLIFGLLITEKRGREYVQGAADGHHITLVTVRPTVPAAAGNTQYFCMTKPSSATTTTMHP